jgi:hypothetical protein
MGTPSIWPLLLARAGAPAAWLALAASAFACRASGEDSAQPRTGERPLVRLVPRPLVVPGQGTTVKSDGAANPALGAAPPAESEALELALPDREPRPTSPAADGQIAPPSAPNSPPQPSVAVADPPAQAPDAARVAAAESAPQGALDGQALARTEIERQLDAFYRDMSAGAWDRFAEHFWPTARVITFQAAGRGEPPKVHGEALDEFLTSARAQPVETRPMAIERDKAEVFLAGDRAHVSSRFHMRYADDIERESWFGVDALIFLHSEGQWKVGLLMLDVQ